MYLSVPIPKGKNVDIYDCLQEMCRKEENIRFECEKCKKVQNGTKQLFIYKLPNILIVHLKRFKFSNYGYA